MTKKIKKISMSNTTVSTTLAIIITALFVVGYATVGRWYSQNQTASVGGSVSSGR